MQATTTHDSTSYLSSQVIDAAGAFGARKDFRVSVAIEQAAHAQLLDGFFRSGGRLLPAAAVPYCNDEEYLGVFIYTVHSWT